MWLGTDGRVRSTGGGAERIVGTSESDTGTGCSGGISGRNAEE
jgi:hypothetical protein